jgi:hypothetical protein
MVVNEQGVLLGRLGRRALADTNHGPVEDAMTEGPSTVRPDTPLRNSATGCASATSRPCR